MDILELREGELPKKRKNGKRPGGLLNSLEVSTQTQTRTPAHRKENLRAAAVAEERLLADKHNCNGGCYYVHERH